MRVHVLFLLGIHLTSAAIHSYQYIYTATSGIENFPEFTVVGSVDGQQINYYDSVIRKLVPKSEWISGAVDPDFWNRNTQIFSGAEVVSKSNINIAKSRFNHTGGVHTIQRMYGCEWDDEAETINGLYQDGYDGEDLVTMDYKELRYIATVPQGVISAEKWNNERGNLEGWKNYLGTICIEWLKKYLQYGRDSFEKIVSPQVSLLQKDPSSPVACHATGFYPEGVAITWMKNGQEHYEDVEVGELLLNEDGTFQKMSSLKTDSEDWKNQNQYSCVVEHKSKIIKKILTKNEIRTNYGDSVPTVPIIIGAVAAILLIVIIIAGYMYYQKKKGFKRVNGSDEGSNGSAQIDPNE